MFSILLAKYDEITFTDNDIQYLKRGKVINEEKWEDYNTVSFKRGYKGNIIVTLLYSRTQLVAFFDDANVMGLRLRVRLIGNEKR